MQSRDTIIQNILSASENVQRQWKSLLAAELGREKITLSQFWALSLIAAEGSVNSRSLSESMYITTGAVSQIIDNLVAENLVSRQNDPTDRRVINLKLTNPGEKLFNKLQQKRQGIFVATFEAFSDLELTAMLAQQHKILDQLQSIKQD
jgi:DNA-binding MarR family transcriptional regulator